MLRIIVNKDRFGLFIRRKNRRQRDVNRGVMSYSIFKGTRGFDSQAGTEEVFLDSSGPESFWMDIIGDGINGCYCLANYCIHASLYRKHKNLMAFTCNFVLLLLDDRPYSVGLVSDPMILPLGNPFESHEEFLSLQPNMFPRQRFNIVSL